MVSVYTDFDEFQKSFSIFERSEDTVSKAEK